jgi:N-acetylmuramic acid 6-phosphate etherase
MDDYKKMGACEKILMNPPRVSRDDLMQFMIGSESDLSRLSAPVSAAVMVAGPSDLRDRDFASFKAAFDKLASSYSKNSSLVIGEGTCGGFSVPLKVGASPLALMERLAVKLVLNTVSTGTMVRLGKVTGNWMSSVEVTNKKLMDRGVRIISSLCGVSYERACGELQKTLEEFSVSPPAVKVSPVRHTMERLSS